MCLLARGRVTEVTRSFEAALALLESIPGVGRRAAEVSGPLRNAARTEAVGAERDGRDQSLLVARARGMVSGWREARHRGPKTKVTDQQELVA